MAIKPGRSSKLEAVIGFDDCGGSTNSPLGAKRFWIVMCSMVIKNGKRKEKIKERIHGPTRFEDNYSNSSPAMAPEMLVGISKRSQIRSARARKIPL
jgi:hypothetical protein